MSEKPLSVFEITALTYANKILANRRYAVNISVAQTTELAGALVQQAETISILIEQNHALCNELDALKEGTNEQSTSGNNNS